MGALWLSAACRVCLTRDREMYCLSNTALEETYEQVTRGTLVMEGRPCCVCGVCLSALRRCRRFIKTAQEANNALDQWIHNHSNNEMLTLTVCPLFSFTRSPMNLFEITSQESSIQEPGVKSERDVAENEDYEIIYKQNEGASYDESNIPMEGIKYEVAENIDTNLQLLSNSECINVYDDMIDIKNNTQILDDVKFNILEMVDDNFGDETVPDALNVGKNQASSDKDTPIKKLRPRKRVKINEDNESRKTISSMLTNISDVDDIENQDQSIPYLDNESTGSLSHDKNYEPSSNESASESHHIILDKPLKVASSYCEKTKTAGKKLSLREVHLDEDSEEDDESSKNNMEVENKVPEDKKTSESNLKGKRIRERDFCYYCENFVLNFARHMTRHHLARPEVQLALSQPKNSLKRKRFFSALRKKGNYASNSQTAVKPVKKCNSFKKTDYYPCSKCLGFYSRKHLRRHVKTCDNITSANNAQVQAQKFLVRNVKVDNSLVTNVFPRMKPDKISLIAKKDKLICMFGAQYLKTHRQQRFATVVSRKMRELAKLLVEVMNLKPNINCFEQLLKPQYYDTLLHATKLVARYNEVSRQFDAPSYAMNIGTSIKRCCSIALLKSCKMEATAQTAAIQADLKTLSKLIQENWKFDISSQAADDLNVKKWNKTTIVPLAADLKLFKDYLCRISKQSSHHLESNDKTNVEAFNNLVESTYCSVLLLNRRRPGELQRLKLSDYNEYDNNTNEEFDKNVTSTEKILINKFKRIVIRSKRDRGVPVLFSLEVQEDIKKILSVRHIYVEKENNFLFVNAGGSTVCGYKTLEKYVKASGAKNYKALTSTRLRKHIATMTQLFTMTESELEQLATSIGHTLSVHINNYRSPNDVYQTAKMSKLLLLIEDRKADKYQGKAFDEIDLNLEEVIGNEKGNKEEIEEERPSTNVDMSISKQAPSLSQDINHEKSARKKRTLVPWTTEQKNVVSKYFKEHIKYKKPPKRAECDDLKNKYPKLLHNKNWLKIKVYIQNTYSKR